MMFNFYEVHADAWEAEQAEIAWWREQEAQYAEDYAHFIECMEALDEDEESEDWDDKIAAEFSKDLAGFDPNTGCVRYWWDC